MDSRIILAQHPDTVGELRTLYRAAEARAARLRLLIEAGRDLAAADAETLQTTLAVAARKAALFSGHVDGVVEFGEEASGRALVAPGRHDRKVGGLTLLPPERDHAAQDDEDAEALSMLCQLMAAAIDRIQQNQDRERLLALLREREQRLEAVVARLFSAQEDERLRVSRDLHDGVAQTASALFRQLDAQKAGISPETAARLAALSQDLIRELRAAIANLRPTVLDDLGLVAAVASLAEALSQDGFDVEWLAAGPSRWPHGLETAFYRVAQEAITNVRKHAGVGCRVRIEVHGDAARGHWRLIVRDRGHGLAPSPPGQVGDQVGMAVMRERMNALGGRLEVVEPEGGGVQVTATSGEAP